MQHYQRAHFIGNVKKNDDNNLIKFPDEWM